MPKIMLSPRAFCLVFLVFYPALSCAELHGTLTMTTNNAFRWFSKTHNSVALQANVDYQHKSGWYLGSSVSNIDFDTQDHPNSAQVEIIPYLGWSFKLSDQWRLDTQWSSYLYTGKLFGHQANYNEFYLFLHYKDLFTGRISFAYDFYGLDHYVIDYELTGRYPVTDSVQFSASFGYSQSRAALGADYPYWNMGFTYFYKFVALDLRYMDGTETFIDYAAEKKLHKLYNPSLLNTAIIFSISMGF